MKCDKWIKLGKANDEYYIVKEMEDEKETIKQNYARSEYENNINQLEQHITNYHEYIADCEHTQVEILITHIALKHLMLLAGTIHLKLLQLNKYKLKELKIYIYIYVYIK